MMIVWLVGFYLALLLILIGMAGFVVLFVAEEGRRRQAFKVLRLLLATSTGVVAVAVPLYQAGLMP